MEPQLCRLMQLFAYNGGPRVRAEGDGADGGRGLHSKATEEVVEVLTQAVLEPTSLPLKPRRLKKCEDGGSNLLILWNE